MYSSFARLRTRGRRAAVVAAAGVVAIVAAGCSNFITQPTASQVAPNGQIAVKSEICLDGFGPDEGGQSAANECQPGGSLPPTGDYGLQGQMLIAYQVPAGSTVPSTLTAAALDGATFSANSNYVTWLDGNYAPASGYEWVGYMSSEFSVTGPEEVDVTADFAPAAPANGQPYSGPYTVKQVMIGDRADGAFDGDSLDAGRALDCDEAVPYAPEPVYDVYPTGCDNDASLKQLTVQTRDLVATAPATAISVQAGSTATVPFTIEYDGPSAQPFQLSASTSSNALTATPANKTYTAAGSGNTTEDVSVPIPSSLAAGSYTVVLNVGAFASQVATIDVTTPTAPVAPETTPSVRPAISGFDVIHRSLTLTLRLNTAATERLTLSRKHNGHWKKLKTASVKGTAGIDTLKLGSVFGSLLKPAGRYEISVQAVEGSLSSAKQSLTFVVR